MDSVSLDQLIMETNIEWATQKALNLLFPKPEVKPEVKLEVTPTLKSQIKNIAIPNNMLSQRGFDNTSAWEITQMLELCKKASAMWKLHFKHRPQIYGGIKSKPVGSATKRWPDMQVTFLNHGLGLSDHGCYWNKHTPIE